MASYAGTRSLMGIKGQQNIQKGSTLVHGILKIDLREQWLLQTCLSSVSEMPHISHAETG